MPSPSDKYILAIDLGTSGPKVALVNAQGQVAVHQTEQTRLMLLPGGGAEQDPEDWWQAICRACRRIGEKQVVRREDIVAVCCTAQWSGTVAVDEQGRHLMNAVIWMDSRGAPYVEKITGGRVRIEGYGAGKLMTWLRLTGGIPSRSGKDPTAHILYIQHQHPEIYAKTYKFLEPKDYLNLRLTGRFAASYDSQALHWVTDNRDIRNIAYHPRLLAMTGIDRAKLPDLKAAVDILGPLKAEAAADLGVTPDIPVIMGTPDVQSAAVGSGAVKDFEAHLYIGTSSWLTCHVPFKKTDIIRNMASLPSAIPGRYFIANEQETAGKCLSFFADNILYLDDELARVRRPENVWDALGKAASAIEAGSDRIIFTPWLYGERTPVENHSIRGGFFNLSLQNTRRHMLRAILEGVAYNARWLMESVEKFIKRPVPGLNIIGGGAQSDTWCQIFADVLERPIHQVAQPLMANVRGTACLAAAALDLSSFEAFAATTRIMRTFEPDPRHRGIYDSLYREFIQIYHSTRRIYARLNRHELEADPTPVGP